MVTSSTLRTHISQIRRAAGSYQFGIYHEGGAPEIAWKIHAKMAAEPDGVGVVRRRDAIDGGSWAQSLPTCRQANKECNQRHGRTLRWAADQLRSEMEGACEAPVAFALALRVVMKEFDEEMIKQGVGWTTDLKYLAYVNDITIVTTAELAPLVMTKLKETLERHGLELGKRQVHCMLPNTRKS